MGELALQSDPAHAVGRRALVVEGTRHARRGRAGKWWMVYHAYENGFYTLGRQTLLEPIEWTADGWFRVGGRAIQRADRQAGRDVRRARLCVLG